MPYFTISLLFFLFFSIFHSSCLYVICGFALFYGGGFPCFLWVSLSKRFHFYFLIYSVFHSSDFCILWVLPFFYVYFSFISYFTLVVFKYFVGLSLYSLFFIRYIPLVVFLWYDGLLFSLCTLYNFILYLTPFIYINTLSPFLLNNHNLFFCRIIPLQPLKTFISGEKRDLIT